MYCQHCGKEIPDDAVICIGCGRAVKPLPKLVSGKKWSGGVLALLIIGAIFIPFVGIVAGIVGLTQEAKRVQGVILLVIGIFMPGIMAAITIPNLLVAIQRTKAKQTMSYMTTIGTAIEDYRVDNGEIPPGNSIEELSGYLAPFYIIHLPTNDSWGNPFRYEFKGDTYFLISFGRDGIKDTFEPYPEIPESTFDFDDDIIFSNGAFIRYPVGASESRSRY